MIKHVLYLALVASFATPLVGCVPESPCHFDYVYEAEVCSYPGVRVVHKYIDSDGTEGLCIDVFNADAVDVDILPRLPFCDDSYLTPGTEAFLKYHHDPDTQWPPQYPSWLQVFFENFTEREKALWSKASMGSEHNGDLANENYDPADTTNIDEKVRPYCTLLLVECAS